MSTEAFETWFIAHSNKPWYMFIKRLAGNDTLATDSHQAGPYIPKAVMFSLFPSIDVSQDNPDATFYAEINSHSLPARTVRAVWYNKKSRDETRFTNWGGIKSPMLDPDSTGSIAIFAFQKDDGRDPIGCHIWICNIAEEQCLEELFGPVEPAQTIFLRHGKPLLEKGAPSVALPCWLTDRTIPPAWRKNFPSGAEIVSMSVSLRSLAGYSADDRLLQRRECEYQIFRSIEEFSVMPRIANGFSSVDDFIEYSNSVNNRRKSRSGRSLELQLARIFNEESVSYAHGEVSEENKKPDFLFPSAESYRSGIKPLWMLAAKTTCKDRWRQILNEADKIPKKHLLTLQLGISENQFAEMDRAGVILVVPRKNHKSYPKSIRPKLLELRTFISQVKSA